MNVVLQTSQICKEKCHTRVLDLITECRTSIRGVTVLDGEWKFLCDCLRHLSCVHRSDLRALQNQIKSAALDLGCSYWIFY